MGIFPPGERDRRTFTREVVLGLLGGVTVTISACRSQDAPTAASNPTPMALPPPTTTLPPVTDKTGVFLANHRHQAVITSAQLTAGGRLRLDIRGEANHPHILDLTASEMAAIGRGEEVGKLSTEEKGHTHYVTFNAPESIR